MILEQTSAIAVLDTNTWLLGTLRGALARYDWRTGVVTPLLQRASVGTISHLERVGDDAVWVSGSKGAPALWPVVVDGAVRAPFGLKDRGPLRPLGDGRFLLVGDGTAPAIVAPSSLPPARWWQAPVGLSTVVSSADRVAVGGADGFAGVIERGRLQRLETGMAFTVKHVVFDVDDGSGSAPILIGGVGNRGPFRVHHIDGVTTIEALPPLPARRLGPLSTSSGGRLWALNDLEGVVALPGFVPRSATSGQIPIDAASAIVDDTVWIFTLSANGGVGVCRPEACTTPVTIGVLPGATSLATCVDNGQAQVVATSRAGLQVASVTTTSLQAQRLITVPASMTTAQCAGHDRFVVGTLDGRVLFYERHGDVDGRVADVPVHQERVAALAITMTAGTETASVTSVGWDGGVAHLTWPQRP